MKRYGVMIVLLLALLALHSGIAPGHSAAQGPTPTQTVEPPCYSYIAFVSDRGGNPSIYLINPNGTGVTLIESTAEQSAYTPVWSPDGRYIAFLRETNERVYQISIMDADGSNERFLTNDTFSNTSPSWSPDGSQLLYIRESWHRELIIVNADGSTPARFTDRDMEPLYVRWSPDGSAIALTLFGENGEDIYVMSADGSEPTNLTDDSPMYDGMSAWSPDSTRLAFASARDGLYDDIFVMNADGSDLVNLTPDTDGSYSPTWSPDGRQITFCRNQDGNREIYVMDSDGLNPVNLTQHPAQDYAPAWSPCLDTPLALSPDTQPTIIPTAGPTPAPTTLTCEDAPPSQLNVGRAAFVTISPAGVPRRNLRVRDAPGGETVDMMQEGTQFMIVGGPQCYDGLLWWEIETLDSALHGWSAEGFAPDDYLMLPEP